MGSVFFPMQIITTCSEKKDLQSPGTLLSVMHKKTNVDDFILQKSRTWPHLGRTRTRGTQSDKLLKVFRREL